MIEGIWKLSSGQDKTCILLNWNAVPKRTIRIELHGNLNDFKFKIRVGIGKKMVHIERTNKHRIEEMKLLNAFSVKDHNED